MSIVIGDDKAAPPGDFPMNFSIILDLKDDLVGVVDPTGKGAVGLGVLVLGVAPVDEGAGNVTASGPFMYYISTVFNHNISANFFLVYFFMKNLY